MHNNVPYTKTNLCATVQLNSTNLDFQTVIITYALFPLGLSIIPWGGGRWQVVEIYQAASSKAVVSIRGITNAEGIIILFLVYTESVR